MKLSLPYRYTPRGYQIEHAWEPFDRGAKRIIEVWHRRAGKDKTAFNIMVREMFTRVGVYYYILPTYSQGRKIIWEGIDAEGVRFLDHIPPQLIDRANNQDMVLETKNLQNPSSRGSLFRVVGSDNIDSVVGTNPRGIVFSEYSLHDPRGWDYFRPVLRENGGWAIFPYTMRGKNHGYHLLQAALKLMERGNPEWYASLLTIDDTKVLSEEDIEMERASGMSEDMIQQEFYCSAAAGARGAYYAEAIETARISGRISTVDPRPDLPTFTFWDLGGDGTGAWWVQFAPGEILVLRYEEDHSLDVSEYVMRVKDIGTLMGLKYAEHWLPWDCEQTRLGQQKALSRQFQETFDELEVGGTVQVAPRLAVRDGIQAVRALLPRCRFDEALCERGLAALENYTKRWDDRLKRFHDQPVHDWASHGADAFRTMAVTGLEDLENWTEGSDGWSPGEDQTQTDNSFGLWR